MTTTVIFDMDGVIVDSEYTFLESKTAMLHSEGHLVDESYHYQFTLETFSRRILESSVFVGHEPSAMYRH